MSGLLSKFTTSLRSVLLNYHEDQEEKLTKYYPSPEMTKESYIEKKWFDPNEIRYWYQTCNIQYANEHWYLIERPVPFWSRDAWRFIIIDGVLEHKKRDPNWASAGPYDVLIQKIVKTNTIWLSLYGYEYSTWMDPENFFLKHERKKRKKQD